MGVEDWGYEGPIGPEFWHQKYKDAKGNRQSPIDIEASKWKVSQSLHVKKFKTHYFPDEMTHVTNDHNHWKIYGDDLQSYIEGGPLRNRYELLQVHAHWGGSEHTVDGKNFPCEMHFVHWNKKKYESPQEALDHQDGYCVIGVFVKVGNPHPEIQKIINNFPNIMHRGDDANMIEPVSAQKLLPKSIRYWSYSGSLTTPPCKECVIWVVLHENIEVSAEQLEAMRKLRNHEKKEEDPCEQLTCGDYIQKNYRPICPLGHRLVIRTKYEHEEKQ